MLGGDLWDNERMPSRPRRPVAKEPQPPPAQASHAVLGYARVSTGHQVLDQQLDALSAAGVEGRVFTDTMSGTRDDRPGLAELMAYARAGDTVTVVALDRLGRSLSGIVQTVKTLGERGIVLRSLREGVDTSTSTGRMVLGIFASLADKRKDVDRRAGGRGAGGGADPRPAGRPPVGVDRGAGGDDGADAVGGGVRRRHRPHLRCWSVDVVPAVVERR